MSCGRCCMWYDRFKSGCESIEDDRRSGRSSASIFNFCSLRISATTVNCQSRLQLLEKISRRLPIMVPAFASLCQKYNYGSPSNLTLLIRFSTCGLIFVSQTENHLERSSVTDFVLILPNFECLNYIESLWP